MTERQTMSKNPVAELHHHYMWSQDNLAKLIDASRPKIKKMIAGEVQPNDLQKVLLDQVLTRQLTHSEYLNQASRVYRLKLIRESNDD